MKAAQVDLKAYKRRGAQEGDCDTLINFDCLITENGKPRILYMKLKTDTSALRWAVKSIRYQNNKRTTELENDAGKNISRVFGFMPKRALRNDFCSSTRMATETPKQHHVITDFATELAEIYREYFPETFEEHVKITSEKVREEWMIGGGPFTSGIVNKDNPLKYHHDAGNFKGVLSNMVAFKKGVDGGRLCCPEFGVKFEIEDNTLLIFDGQSILHGVTPINKLHPDAYRYTIVYYSLMQMWRCDSVNEEIYRIRKVKKAREIKRLTLTSDDENINS